jgi:hypothetical protein
MTLRHVLGAALWAAFAVVFAFAAGAQEAAGKWNASIDTPQGPFAFQLEFAVAGNTLTGAMTNEFFGTTPITDGTTNGKDVAFKIKFDAPDGSMVISYSGTVSGNEMTLTSKFDGTPPGGGPAEMTFTAARAQ